MRRRAARRKALVIPAARTSKYAMADVQAGTEPELDPTDPYAREAQTFPRLSEQMAQRIALRQVTLTDRNSGASSAHPIANLFLLIGAEPNTEWLNGCLALDTKGFVRTGRDGEDKALASPFATTKPGIFAVGDVRSGSVKRVASGVGEGSVVVQAIHQFLNPGVA